ncbi:Alpha/Beta hydrolase protein [Aspergillus pseudoustus]|uniref:Alpha/Beta hydrolase protein n=1 Tax=Aspergillus pseudoustus TaxID=1810923 RepID=A0ABR4K3N3_9EURO
MSSKESKQWTPGPHTFTAANGITFHYLIRGHGPLLVVQSVGWGPSMHLYSNSLNPLEDRFTVLYFESRGSGKSTRPASADEMSTRTLASDLEYLRLHLGEEELWLWGHSNGGAIVLAYAEDFPERVEKLVLVNHELQGFSSDNFQTFAAARKDHPVYGPALATIVGLMQSPPATDEEFRDRLLKAFPYYMHDTEKTHLLEEVMEGGSLSVWNFLNQSRCDARETFSAVDGLDKIRARTLVVNGRSDGICSEVAARKVVDVLGDRAELVLVEEAGHLPWIEQPHIFFPVVERFLLSNE